MMVMMMMVLLFFKCLADFLVHLVFCSCHFNLSFFFEQLTERDATIKELHSLIDQIKEERLQDEEVRYQRSILAKRQVYVHIAKSGPNLSFVYSFI